MVQAYVFLFIFANWITTPIGWVLGAAILGIYYVKERMEDYRDRETPPE